MSTLRLASFGMRGYVGDSLTPEGAMDLAAAFGTFASGGPILVGRDTRFSSRMLHSAVISGLMSTGCEVLDFDICPTPILQFSVAPGAAGAVSISGGHNRAGYNALTLIGPTGAFLEPVGGETVLDIFHARDFLEQDFSSLGELQRVADFEDPYLAALTEALDVESIRKANFTVAVDPVNGAGSRFLEPLSAKLGFKLIAVNADESGDIAHDPEPNPRNARQVAEIVRHVGADIGFVSSSDMGRLALVAEDGEPACEEYTFAVIAAHLLEKQPGPVVTNCCTSRTIDDLCRKHDVQLVKSPVGQAYVLSGLADVDGVVGGEGSGSAAMPAFSRAFDAFLMMGVILECMAQRGLKPSELVQQLPRYHILKRQVSGEARRCYQALESLTERHEWCAGGTIDRTDGIRVDWHDGWVHVRASRTEAMVRIISESTSRGRADERAAKITQLLEREL